jgi:DNA-binding winged helix-turn-helix (wHTH) protein/TolB-like protein
MVNVACAFRITAVFDPIGLHEVEVTSVSTRRAWVGPVGWRLWSRRADELMSTDLRLERIDLANEPAFMLGALEVRPPTREVVGPERREVLEPRVMQVLVALARRRGEVVSRDALVAACWSGRAVGEDAIQRCIAKLRRLADATGGFEIETLARVGYRLTERARAQSRSRRVALAFALALIVGVAGALGVWIANRRPPHPEASAPTAVAIMPFRVDSPSPEGRYFADSLTDTIQSALSSNQIRVVSRTDAGALASPGGGTAMARLGVRLLLDGSTAADDKTLDVSVHVEDALNHLTLWSGHFTGPAERPDELKTSVAATAVAVLSCSADAVGPHGLSDPQTLMLYLRACDLAEHVMADAQAREQLFEALRQITLRAPRFAPGLAMRAEQLATLAVFCCSPDQAAALRADARADADRALAIDPANSRAYAAQSLLLPPTDWRNREAILRRALKADPDAAWANGYLGQMLAEVGRIQEAADLIRKANVANPLALDWSADSARMAALAGRTQEAADEAAQIAKSWPNDGYARLLRLEVAATEEDWDGALALLNGGRVDMSPELIEAARSATLALKTPTPALRAKARSDVLAVAAAPGGLQLAIENLARMGFVDDAFNVAQAYQPLTTQGVQPGFLFTPGTASLRRDPRFMRLAGRIGLTRYWRGSSRWPDFCSEPRLPYDCKAEAARLAEGHS